LAARRLSDLRQFSNATLGILNFNVSTLGIVDLKNLAAILVCALTSLVVASCTRHHDLIVSQVIEEAKQALDMPSGTAIVVVQGDKIIYEGYFGFAQVSERKPVGRNTLFYIASLTKPFFATATLLAEHRGDIATTSTLSALFPDLEFETIEPEKVTVQHLISHSMGFDNELMEWTTAYTGLHDEIIRQGLVASPTSNDDGGIGTFSYSNIGYNILSVWFDRFYQRSWQETLDDFVFAPSVMAQSTAIISEAQRKGWDIVRPYSYKVANGKKPIYLSKTDDTMHAAGGIVSTAPDVGRFVLAHLNEGMVDGNQAFPAEVIKKAHETIVSTDANGGGYAWGWFVNEYEGYKMFSHTGGYPGASAMMSFIPEHEIGVVILHNEGGLKANVLNGMITRVVYGELLHNGREDVREQFDNKLESLVTSVAKAEAKLVADAKTRAATNWHLRHRKEDYAGSYSHPLGGTLTVALTPTGDFNLTWGRLMSAGIAHTEEDSLWHEFKPGSFKALRFQTDAHGVNSLEIAGTQFDKAVSKPVD
jgi:CubicO group peptidase (beta-lactamase class C family)